MRFLESGWQVLAFEPDPDNRSKLESNAEGYEGISISERVVSDQEDKIVSFYQSEESSGISSVTPFTEGHQLIGEVKTTTLASEISKKKIDKIDFLKIDTEGHEMSVLNGFPWPNLKPTVIECEFEDNKTRSLGYSATDLAVFLQDKGYVVVVSEWYPITRYGVRHTWKGMYRFDGGKISEKAWGNLLAFDSPEDEMKFARIAKQFADQRKFKNR